MTTPQFIIEGGFNWSSCGYHYRLTRDERDRLLSQEWDDEPWDLLGRVVELAKIGDFSQVGSLARFFETSDQINIAPVALLVTGDIGGRPDLERLVHVMRNGPDGLRVYACQAARNAGCLWLVPHMLEAWNSCSGIDAHESIGYAIADLLDPIDALDELGPVGSRAGRFDVDLPPSDARLQSLARRLQKIGSSTEFNRLVREKHQELLARCETENDAVWAGERSGVIELARYFLRMLSPSGFDFTQAPLTVVLREKFEASTGLNCSTFFREGRFLQGKAMSTLESFLASPQIANFRMGARYFFDHPVR